jgi:hypothetical protein
MDVMVIDRTTYKNGEVIRRNAYKSLLWVERYLDPGEFKIIATPSDYLIKKLYRGALITHVDTREVMIVENHQIKDKKTATPTLTISGRSLDSFLENRMAVLNNQAVANSGTKENNLYNLFPANSWEQARLLIRDHIFSTFQLLSAMDNLPNVTVVSTVSGNETEQLERIIKRGQLDKAVREILALSGSGLKIMRPIGGETLLQFVIHQGVDRTNDILFSYDAGDIEEAEYLWSNKKRYNGALIAGQYYSYVLRPTGVTGYDVRMLYVDASDYDVSPVNKTTLQLEAMDKVLKNIGLTEMGPQQDAEIVDATISSTTKYKYRTDYEVGDLVYLSGNYGVNAPMRVTEFAESEDEDGYSGIPTLSSI